MKLMQSGIDFFGQGAGATYPCSCGCFPELDFAIGDARGLIGERCGCWCGCTGELKADASYYTLTDARDAP